MEVLSLYGRPMSFWYALHKEFEKECPTTQERLERLLMEIARLRGTLSMYESRIAELAEFQGMEKRR